MLVVACAILIVVLLTTNILCYIIRSDKTPKIASDLNEAHQKDEKNVVKQRVVINGKVQNKFSAAEVSQKLENLKVGNPDLTLLAERCLTQLKSVKNDKKQFEVIMMLSERNFSLSMVQRVFDEVEQSICQNINDILNLCVIAGSEEGQATWDKLNQKSINEELESNDLKLKKNDELLDVVVELVNQHDDEFSNLDIDAWITAIRQQLSAEHCKNSG